MDVATHEPATDLLNDTGELDVSETVKSEVLTHFAKCLECAVAVRFRPSASGAGFMLIDEDPDAVFGVSANGLPLCPNGHGELSIADEQLPAADAFAAAQAMQAAADGPVQRTLPGVFPKFNFEACFMELEAKAVEVDRLHRDYKSAAEEAREAKKEWDTAAELYTKMALEFRRRRQAKEDGTDQGAETAPKREPCAWEAKHPTLRVCPICSGQTVPAVLERILGTAETPPPDAALHADRVDELLNGLEREELLDVLASVDTYIDPYLITAWSDEDRAAALVWARAELDRDPLKIDMTERPAILAKPHIPSQPVPGEHQVCSFCEMVIKPASEIEASGPYKVTDYVGTDCPGKPAKVAHHYPKGSKKKPAAKAKKK